ncbi:MAG: YeeE/YedE thiosulfate transporter family protein [Ascidiaceihabitans sp.]|nr:YeeE/YedE thiosulfate transporter family protein [Ascidiaceihabitans sp.]
METEFTPFTSLLGGALIGLSAVVLLASHGRIAGISGIVSRILPPSVDKAGLPQAIIFLIGLLLAAPLWFLLTGAAPVQVVSGNGLLLVIAGLLVGFGSVIGNGCTSGHGVCGISRGSARSIAATIIFMATAFLTVFILRHVVGG